LLSNPSDTSSCAQLQYKTAPPYYTRGRVCLIGHAASSNTALWQGLDHSQAIEDVLVLATLLEEIKEPSELEAVLELYNEMRRPRREEVAKIKENIDATFSEDSTVELKLGELRTAFASLNTYKRGIDMEKYKLDVLAVCKKHNRS